MLKNVTMIGALPPLKGNAYYCMSLAREMSLQIEVDFIAFKKIYPEFLYPGGVTDDDEKFCIEENRYLSIRRMITYYNPFSWICAGWAARSTVVHLQWWSIPLAPIFIVLLFMLKLRKKKIIFTVHNVIPHERILLDYLLAKAVLRLGDVYIVHTESNREGLIKSFNIPKRNIHVVHMPVHNMYEGGRVDRHEVRKTIGLPADGNIILSFGNLREYKGVDRLIEAMPLILKDVPKAHLLIVGQKWGDWERYKALIARLNLERQTTTILRYIPMSEVKDYFHSADLVVLPYKNFDAQSGVGNIALAFEVPMVVTRVGGLPELVKDERAVCEANSSVALSEAIKPILLDQYLHSKLKVDACALKKAYSWPAAIDATLKIYNQLVDNRTQ